MKNYILAFLVFTTTSCFADRVDSTFQRHQFSFAGTNAISHEFVKFSNTPAILFISSPEGTVNNPAAMYSGINILPLYALHLQVKYSLGISRHVRIETGIGYLLQGFTYQYRLTPAQYQQLLADSMSTSGGFNHYAFNGSITIPLHIKFMKQLKSKGAFTCTVGLDFSLPVHSFDRYVYSATNGTSKPIISDHEKYNTSITARYSGGGVDLKMGYEKMISHNSAIDIGPIVSFNNLFYFSNQLNQSYKYEPRPYQYYIGLDVAFNWCLGN